MRYDFIENMPKVLNDMTIGLWQNSPTSPFSKHQEG